MPWVVWLTGLPGSGKSTIARSLKERVGDAIILNMDDLRRVVTPQPSYSDSEREYVYRAIVYTAKRLHEAGHNVIIDATGNRRRWRELARRLIPGFLEVYLVCPVDVCMERERERIDTHGAPKDIYKKAEEGWPVPGRTVPYEEPTRPELTIHTDRETPEGAVDRIVKVIADRI